MEREHGTDLAGPDCYAVVIGTGLHVAGARLTGLPSATRSATAIARTLRSMCGMAEDRVRLITDPGTPTDVLAAVQAAVDRAEGGVVVFCFVGHGLLGPGDQLYLATSASTSADSTVHAVPYAEVRNLLSAAPVRPVVILDCCFSGLAEAARHGPLRDPYVAARPDGSFLLASATHYAASFAPEGEEHTLFSGELLRLLEEGDAGGPRWFTLADIHRHLDRRMQNTPARPHADSSGRIGDLVIAANSRYTPAAEPAPAEPGGDGPCPYPGMRPFLPEQRHLFFGREELTRALVERVTTAGPGEPVVLVGPSGVGKSSLLRAGLGAALEDRGEEPVLLIPAPGARPFRTLTTRWAQAVGRPFGEMERELGAGRFPGPADGRRGPGVLMVDQLEEIFTHCRDAEERELFVRALSGGEPGGGSGGPRIVLGLRADYFGRCLRDIRLSGLLRAGQFTVPPMSDEELRSAIEQPAAYAGLRLEDGLTGLLLRDLRAERVGAGDAIALPFLAHALQETWTRRRGALLTLAGYQATGGIHTSVARAAERIHGSLDTEGRRRLRELLLRMVQLVDADGTAVRRRVPLGELGGATGLLGELIAARLVVVDDGEAQLCHDSLLHGWPRLREWINADLDGLLVRRRLGEAADAWDEAGRPASGLYAGRHLAAAQTLTEDGVGDGGRSPFLRPVERDFLSASGRAERHRRRLLRTGVATLLVLAVLSSTLAVLARRAQGDAEQRETVLIAQQLATQADAMREHDPQTALRLSLAAYRTARTPESRSSLYTAYLSLTPIELRGIRQPVLNLAFGPGGDVLATSQRGGRVQLWDIGRPTVPRKAGAVTLHSSAAIAFHPRTSLLAAQTRSGLTLWDTSDPDRPRRLAKHGITEGATYTLAFSPDGRTLASGSRRGKLRLWDVSVPARPVLRAERTVADVDLVSLAFNRDGRLLVTGSGVSGENGEHPARVRLWDVSDPGRPAPLGGGTAGSVMAVAFHPGRDLVVATGGSGRMTWWVVEEGRRLRSVEAEEYESQWGSGGDLPSLSFHRDGTTLVAAESSKEGRTLLRRVGRTDSSLIDGTAERAALPAGEPVQSVAHSPDGAYIAAGEMGGVVRLWPERPPAPAVAGTLETADPGARPISEDGRLLITTATGEDDTATSRVWDVGDTDEPRLSFTVPQPWRARYFLPNRRTPVLLAHHWNQRTGDHFFRLWEFGPGRRPNHGKDIPFTAADVVTDVSDDGRLLAISEVNAHRVELWDVTDTHRPVRRAVIDARTSYLSMGLWFLSPQALAVVEGDDLRIWDLTDPDRPRRAGSVKGAGTTSGAAYSRASKLLITEELAENLRLWDTTDMHRLRKGARLPAAPGGYYMTARDVLVTVLNDGTVRFWDVADHRNVKPRRTMRLDRTVTSVSTSPDGDWVVTGLPHRIWSVGPDGQWRTPSVATLHGAKRVQFLPDRRPYMAVVPNNETVGEKDRTFLLGTDADRVYRELCRTHPLSVGESQWKNLFPHLEHRRSCD